MSGERIVDPLAASSSSSQASQASFVRTTGRALDKPWHRTFIKQRPRLSAGQKRALREYWRDFGLEFRFGDARLDARDVYGDIDGDAIVGGESCRRKFVLELGFGLGESMVASARTRPDFMYLGVEVHKPGVATALNLIAQENLTNVRVVSMDGLWMLRDFIQPASVDECCVYFPDPWRGENKAKRRLVNDLLLEQLELAMVRGGRLNITSDDAEYQQHVVDVMARHVESWTPTNETFDRFDSKYARKAVEEGRTIRDFAFVYTPVRV